MCLPPYIVFCALNANVSANGSLTSALIANVISVRRLPPRGIQARTRRRFSNQNFEGALNPQQGRVVDQLPYVRDQPGILASTLNRRIGCPSHPLVPLFQRYAVLVNGSPVPVNRRQSGRHSQTNHPAQEAQSRLLAPSPCRSD